MPLTLSFFKKLSTSDLVFYDVEDIPPAEIEKFYTPLVACNIVL